MNVPTVVLASASPRRTVLLDMLGLAHEVVHANVDETLVPDESAAAQVERLACAKALAVADLRPDAIVLGADTVVVLDGQLLGKPASRQDALATLLRLAGRDHMVLSGLALVSPGGVVYSAVSTTLVTFLTLHEDLARCYVSTGEVLDKAGSYGIQGLGAALIESIEGDYFTVVGLPVPELMRLLERAGWQYTFGAIEPLE